MNPADQWRKRKGSIGDCYNHRDLPLQAFFGFRARSYQNPIVVLVGRRAKLLESSRMNLCCRGGMLAGLLLVFSTVIGADLPVPTFKVGAAKRDITPSEALPMWGYGARHDTLSAGKLDPLYATALVIEAGTNKLAIVGLDLGRAPSEKSLQNIRQRIKTEAGIEYSFIAGSHTHHGPVLELSDQDGKGKGKFDAAIRYYQQLDEGIVAAIGEANSKLTPARMATGSVKLDGFNRNRHTRIEPKPVDRELAVMRFHDLSGKPIAVLVNFAAHPTLVPASALKFSADYVGALKAAVEKELGGTAVFMQGASGDLSANPAPETGYQAFGQALGREVVKLASSVATRDVAHPTLVVREERFQFASRAD